MKNYFIHVGLGRCSNITLIKEIYPLISNFTSYKFSENIPRVSNLINNNYEKMIRGIDHVKKLNFNNNLIVCDERLCSWNPYNWEFFADCNLKMFGKESNILLTFREPDSYFRSMYLAQCVYGGNLMTEKDYFLSNEEYDKKNTKTFAIELFSFDRIYNLYKQRFSKVYVIKYSEIKSMIFFSKYFKLSSNQTNILIDNYKNIYFGASYKKLAVKLTFFIFIFLNSFIFIFNNSFFKKIFLILKKKSLLKNKLYTIETKKIVLNDMEKNFNEKDYNLNIYRSFLRLIKWNFLMNIINKIYKKKYDVKIPKKFSNHILKNKKEFARFSNYYKY